MARQTLIEIVQDLLSDMDSDEVNSISDTIEAEQVARVVRRAFYDILEEMDLPSKGDLLKLESASSADFPTRLKIPNATSRIDWIKYAEIGEDSEKIYHNVTYKSPADFISLVAARDPTGDDVQVVTYSTGIELPIQNDKFPTYWTSFDDDYIWFDSWDSDESSTIVANHSLCFGHTTPTFTMSDNAYPDLPDNLFPYLYSKAKSICFADLKQSINQKSEQSENRLRIRSQRNKWRQGRKTHEGPDFGKR